jgi:hypothetical protein
VTATCRDILEITRPAGAGGKLTALQSSLVDASVDSRPIAVAPSNASAGLRAT